MRFFALKAVLAVVLIGAVPLLAGSAAHAAATSIALGQTGFDSIVVDDAHGHVLVSAPAANEVLVFDLAGNLAKTIPNVYGAGAMVVHGSTLYVVETTTGSVEQIDLGTLTDMGPLATGLASPGWLAFAGGKLWTSVTSGGGWAQLASIGPSGNVTTYPTTYYDPDFATTPADPNALYVAEDGLSPGAVYRLDVSSGSPVVAASNTFTDQSNIEQLAVSADGTRVIPAAGYPYKFEELGASTLAADGIVYPGQPYPSAVAVSSGNRGLVATGLNNGYSSPDISVFRLGVPQAIFTATTTNASGTANVVPHGLALTADGSRLFAVTADDVYQTSFQLSVFVLGPSATTTTLTAAPSPSGFGQSVTATATVASTDGGGTVSFYANNVAIAGCAALPLTKAATAACSTAALPLGQVSLSAVYSGDAQYAGSTGTTSLTVNKGTTGLAAAPSQLVKAKGGTFTGTLSATLTAYGAPVAGRAISFRSGSTALCSATTDATGAASCAITVKSTATYRALVTSGYTASFAGDSQYLASSGSATVTG
jgi:hypothetical protein